MDAEVVLQEIVEGPDSNKLVHLGLLGESVQPLTTQPWKWRHVHVLRELGVLLNLRDHPQFTWTDWLRSMRPPVYFLDWNWRDWRRDGEDSSIGPQRYP